MIGTWKAPGDTALPPHDVAVMTVVVMTMVVVVVAVA